MGKKSIKGLAALIAAASMAIAAPSFAEGTETRRENPRYPLCRDIPAAERGVFGQYDMLVSKVGTPLPPGLANKDYLNNGKGIRYVEADNGDLLVHIGSSNYCVAEESSDGNGDGGDFS